MCGIIGYVHSVLRYQKTLSNIKEVKAREGKVIAVACEGDEEIRNALTT